MEELRVSDFFDIWDYETWNWSTVWWHTFTLCWLIFGVYILQTNKVRKMFVFTSFFIMSSGISLFSASLEDEPPVNYVVTLFGFSLVLMGIVYFNQVSPGKPFGPLLFRLLLLLQLGYTLEALARYHDYPITSQPHEGEILNVDVQYLNKYPGDMYLNGKYKMHITCFGEGKHLVLLDAGMPYFSASLSGVAHKISDKYKNTTVCTYDRLGYGWSERTFNNRNTVNMVNELRSLLAHARVNGKRMLYIGWSFGGLIAQLYARLYPREMLGLVLVDSMDHQVLRDDPELKGAIEYGKHMFTLTKILAPVGFMRLCGVLGLLPPECGFPLANTQLPKESEQAMRAVFFHQNQFLDAAFAELNGLVAALNQSDDLLGTPEKVPENLPTVVLRSGLRMHPAYNKSHKRLLRLSANKVELLTNKSDHYIPLYDPDSIVEAVQRLFILRGRLQKEKKLKEI